MFNNELQRSEKMEIISELAASVAHEVRNPLQVTRDSCSFSPEKPKPRNANIWIWLWWNWTVHPALLRIS